MCFFVLRSFFSSKSDDQTCSDRCTVTTHIQYISISIYILVYLFNQYRSYWDKKKKKTIFQGPRSAAAQNKRITTKTGSLDSIACFYVPAFIHPLILLFYTNHISIQSALSKILKISLQEDSSAALVWIFNIYILHVQLLLSEWTNSHNIKLLIWNQA